MSYRTVERPPAVTEVTESSFKGYPTLVFPNPDNVGHPGIVMGLTKLRAILPWVEAVEAFVAKHTEPAASGAALAETEAQIEALKAQIAAMAAMLAKSGNGKV